MEPVMHRSRPHLEYHQATCDSINFEKNIVECTDGQQKFSLHYDKLILAPGAESNTFGIKGVRENALFLKDIKDARRIRNRIIECFDKALRASDDDKRKILHFQIVGGGPTGVEFSAELHDFITEDLKLVYPQMMSFVKITLYDVAPRILGAFNEALAQYATKRFERNGVQIRTQTRVDRVEKDCLVINMGEVVPFGLLVWATGITQTPLIQSLVGKVKPDPKGTRRLMTDSYLRVLDTNDKPIENVFALGDCATIENQDLPATAQVANQKAWYLCKQLNQKPLKPFNYRHMGSMAYIGGWRAVVDLPKGNTAGLLAWIFWRSAYLAKSVSWKNRIMIPMFWIISFLFGRDVSRIK